MERIVKVGDHMGKAGAAAVDLVASVKDALDDGWQPILDIPDLAMDAFKTLPEIYGDADKVIAEIKADIPTAIQWAGIVAGDIWRAIAK